MESPAIASSDISSFGRVAIARASSILRSSTWLSVVADASALDARPMPARIDIAVSRRCAAETSGSVATAKSSATIRFSTTVMLLNGRGIWKLRAMPRRVRTWAGNCVMSSPRNTHGAGLGAERAGDAVDQRRLARAVRADQAEPLAGSDIDADIVERGEAAEAFCKP